MLVVISGVPGTGKSEISKELSRILNAKLIELKSIAVKRNLIVGLDEKRSSLILNENKISSAMKAETSEKGNYVLDSHLGHFTEPKMVKLLVVLRCNPKTLETRLKKRRYNGNKVNENTMAEYLDTILIEALDNGYKNKIHEIDTTKKKAEQAAREIAEVLKGKRKKSFGSIRWF